MQKQEEKENKLPLGYLPSSVFVYYR